MVIATVPSKVTPAPAKSGSDTPGSAAAQAAATGPIRRPGRLRTRTLITLRWLALAGQALTLVVVGEGLRFPAPYLACAVIVGIGACLNLALSLTPAARRTALDWEAGAQLAFDVVQLAALLYLTGGLANPFSLLIIAPVILGSASLPTRYAAGLALLAIVAILGLAVASMPLPWIAGHALELPVVYRAGLAVALVAGIAFAAAYAHQAAAEAARMELALNVTETVLAREQRMSALGALAAAAAHELGTPLATIAVVAKEMAREVPDGPLREDAFLLIAQAQRCRDILRRLAEMPEATDEVHERMSLLQFVSEVVQPYADAEAVRVEAVVSGASGVSAPDVWRWPEVLHAMTSIVENAFDFARKEILVTARFDAETVQVEVRDDGPGFSPAVLAKLGEPYVTSRPGAEGSRTGHIGMGLGFFIAKTLLERTGAVVEFRNGRRGGAIVAARWQRTRIEATPIG
ncbi:MAG TPA: ActS/PrrB/RegB family redox-sensitive histidine kinase [Caulobacteraceae bacterium]|jgi:two-component system sensor histidine kinase RegB|nr:ActS/PrrB/RegB family redox-sensitive histidine kinase [Caulobacteraceae bacterium]HEX4097981.1 ActS/PrrB/RegB family redox-sensitive histidine kinase [Caulobacteraceae bacterium]